jgi:hypothetical protein
MKRTIITIIVIAVFAAGFTAAALSAKGGGADAADRAANDPAAPSAAATVFELKVPVYARPLAEDLAPLEPSPSEDAPAPSQSGSDPITVLTEDENFTSHGMTLKEISAPVKLDRQTAIDKADAFNGGWNGKEAEAVTAVLALFTDQTTNPLSGTGIVLKDYPAWIVTYHGVTMRTGGPKNSTGPHSVYGDSSVVIDANSGEWLISFSYSVK